MSRAHLEDEGVPCKPGCRYGTHDDVEGGYDLSHDGDCPNFAARIGRNHEETTDEP